jgi:hypothetical protein
MVGKKAETMRELKQLVEKHIQNRIRKRGPEERKCRNCGSKFIVLISGADTCTVCGTSEVSYFSHYISYNYNKDDYLKKKSCHKRVRWFERHLLKHVANRDRDKIREQFRKIVRCIQRLRLQRGRNIVRYKFYLLRLASMNGTELIDPPEDIRTEKIVNILEVRLYGKVFVELGWKPEGCHYYNNWKNRES